MYIPFVSLLGIQAALESFVSKESASEPALITAEDFVDPRPGGGSLLDHDSGGLGEPLNVIISGQSDPWVLADGGFVYWANGLGFGKECFGAHLGKPQTADLGDGNGWTNQVIELRNDYGNPDIGACWESLIGGNHFRMWRQNGPKAHTNALFLAISQEKVTGNFERGAVSLFNWFKFAEHLRRPQISKNGYDVGRDKFVKSALGLKQWGGIKYKTVARNITGLIPSGSAGINHGIATDGVIVLLTVTILK